MMSVKVLHSQLRSSDGLIPFFFSVKLILQVTLSTEKYFALMTVVMQNSFFPTSTVRLNHSET